MKRPVLLQFIVCVVAATAVLWPLNTAIYLWHERTELDGKTIEGTIGTGWFAVSVAEPLLFSLAMGAVAYGLWRGASGCWAGWPLSPKTPCAMCFIRGSRGCRGWMWRPSLR